MPVPERGQQRWIFPSKTGPGVADQADYEQYLYDPNGNRVSLRKRDGRMLGFDHDALNRVVIKYSPDGTVRYAYDLRGLQTAAWFTGTGWGVVNSYDGFGRLASSATNMDGVSRALSSQYDADGNRTALSGDQGYYAPFSYDGLGRMKAYADIVQFGYDAAGRRSSLNMGPGWTSASVGYGYDPAGRLQTLSHDLGGTGADQALGFAYNPVSQIQTRSASNGAYAWSGSGTYVRGYAANGLNQYTGATSTGAPAVSYLYDLNGNLISDGTRSYVYDAENRLVSASGAENAALTYDPLGRLWQVTSGASTTRFLYDGDRLAMEYNSAGAVTRSYVHGPKTDEPLVWYDAASGWARRFLHADHQGSIIALNDDAGTPVATNAYDPWGIPNAGAGHVGRFGYTGQTWIPELGLWYYKARIYSPTVGRFLQTDPVGYDDGMNLYAYVGNDPVNNTDPTGTEVRAIFYAEAGLIRSRDNDTGEVRWASAFSGGTSNGFQGGPIPGGNYAILDGPNDNSYRLERLDTRFGDDTTPEGRTDLRLHPEGTRSVGCITCHPGKGGAGLGELLRGTRTSTVTVDYRGRNPFRSTEQVRQFGTLRVNYGSNVRFDRNSMRVSVFHPGDRNHRPRLQYVCTVQPSGRCIR